MLRIYEERSHGTRRSFFRGAGSCHDASRCVQTLAELSMQLSAQDYIRQCDTFWFITLVVKTLNDFNIMYTRMYVKAHETGSPEFWTPYTCVWSHMHAPGCGYAQRTSPANLIYFGPDKGLVHRDRYARSCMPKSYPTLFYIPCPFYIYICVYFVAHCFMYMRILAYGKACWIPSHSPGTCVLSRKRKRDTSSLLALAHTRLWTPWLWIHELISSNDIHRMCFPLFFFFSSIHTKKSFSLLEINLSVSLIPSLPGWLLRTI